MATFSTTGVVALLLVLATASHGLSLPGSAKAKLYIVELRTGLPLATYRGQIPGYPATAPRDEGPDLDSAFPEDAPEAELPPAPDGLVGGHTGDFTSVGASVAAGSGAAAPAEAPAGNGRQLFSSSASSHPSTSTPKGARFRRPRLNLKAPHVQAFKQTLQRQQRQVAADIGLAVTSIAHQFQTVSHGFAAALTPLQLWRLKRHPAVAGVRRSRIVRKYTFDSPTFLGLPDSLWQEAGGQSSAGADVVVGVVDTGIWPENQCFDDTGLSGTPSTWQGTCETSSDFSCTGKVIGARKLYSGFQQESSSGPDFSYDYNSPRDSDGHGTWCAGAAAGVKASWSTGDTSGMAPAARLAIYKVFWTDSYGTYATDADILAAVDYAVADGVDVLSLSLGGANPADTYFGDVAFLNANAAGMVVAFAAGNSGGPKRFSFSMYRSIDNFSPFYITVGASTIQRGGAVLGGASVKGVALKTTAGALTSVATSGSSTNSTTPARAARPAAVETAGIAAPMVAGFSSRGPLVRPIKGTQPPYPTNSILKPDIIGPGVELWAATPAYAIGDPAGLAQLSGTSMATPHIAGIAALIVQQKPDWSPAQVMSAMMTTATIRNTNGKRIKNTWGRLATPWEIGAGHVYPPKMLDPGLTYDAGESHYRNFLAGQSFWQAKKYFPGATLQRLAPRNLNRASISIGRMKGYRKVRRTVTNVADTTSTYTGTIVCPYGVVMIVNPKTFTIAPGESVTFTVSVWVNAKSWLFHYGSLTWRDEVGHVVRSPIAVQPLRYIKW
ncbi:hypothetical protein CLOM_g3019 [Closterium sp. NIES-68]|nr:hypothetical protein CLOM_g3019 [Closterium sp. NIES-68]GJP86563.1 hypothetical protein CLOP_g16573 [Closterium sp. NIES-67]